MKSIRKTVTKKSVGLSINGISVIQLLGNNTEYLCDMEETFIPINKKLTKSLLLSCVNDNDYGCEHIVYATIEVFVCYDDTTIELFKTIKIDKNQCNNYQHYFKKGI